MKMDEDQWQLLEDMKEGLDQLNMHLKMIAEIMLYDLQKKYGGFTKNKIYDRL